MTTVSNCSTEELFRVIRMQEQEIATLQACIDRRSHDPAWKISNAHAVHDEIALIPPQTPVKAAVGDIADLKQWNSAMGAQAPFDAILKRGFASVQLRKGDILGRGDGGDKIYLVCPEGRGEATDVQGVTKRINETLGATPLRAEERAAYVRGACAKQWGPWLGRAFEALHYLGLRPIADYPRIDWAPVADGAAAGVLARIEDADRALFLVKKGGQP